tara:strand:+ start:16842 stop:17414 length:573 start_codon:yes stop_codon:yes gene_type:complete
MGVIASSIDDGDGRYGSRTRVNRLVYEFTNADLASQTSATADVNLNGKIHNIIIDATRCTVGSGTTTGSFQLLAADLTDGAGTPALYSYHNEISFMDYSAASPAPYYFQTSEGGATADGGVAHSAMLTVTAGLSSAGGPPKTPNGAGALVQIDDVIKWTGLVCGTVRLKVATSSAWGAGTGSLFVTLIYD